MMTARLDNLAAHPAHRRFRPFLSFCSAFLRCWLCPQMCPRISRWMPHLQASHLQIPVFQSWKRERGGTRFPHLSFFEEIWKPFPKTFLSYLIGKNCVACPFLTEAVTKAVVTMVGSKQSLATPLGLKKRPACLKVYGPLVPQNP